MQRLILAMALLVIGCGTTTGGGGATATGGIVAGSPCNDAVHEGCSLVLGGSERMACVGGKWAVLQVCAPGTVCAQLAVAGVVGQTACVNVADVTSTTDAGADATSGDATGGQDATSGDGALSDASDGSDSGAFSGPDGLSDAAIGADVSQPGDGFITYDTAYPSDGYVSYDSYVGYDTGFPNYDGYVGYDAVYPSDGYVGYDTGYPSYDAYDNDAYVGYDMSVYDAGVPDYDGYSGYDTGGDPCVYPKPTYQPGCTSPTDQSYVSTLLPGTSGYAAFADIVQSCTLTAGCLSEGQQCMTLEGQQSQQGECIAACIAQKTNYLMSDNCAWCYGEYSGVCGYTYCLADCAVSSTSAACTSCLSMNCDNSRSLCVAGY